MGGGCPLPFLFIVDLWMNEVSLNFNPMNKFLTIGGLFDGLLGKLSEIRELRQKVDELHTMLEKWTSQGSSSR